MKKLYFIVFFISFHILLIGIKINKQSQFIKISYERQRLEQKKIELLQQKQALTNDLYAFQNPALIKQFAQDVLNMEPLNLKQVKRITTS
ncbi:MAG: hypothetical protein EBU90_09045 [Proteobacteria bacterium]|jgi:hypothetical protein|nr:hypothetical protein [Pseudomonadota bacterium]